MSRIENLQVKMQESNIDYVIVTDPNAVNYFTERLLSVGERFLGLVVGQSGTPDLYLNIMFPVKESEQFNIVRFSDTDKVMKLVGANLKGTVGIDKFMDAHFLLELMGFYPENNYVVSTIVDVLKAVKNESEREKMRIASKLNDEVMDKVRTLIQLGKSEKQLADEIAAEFRRVTGGTGSFDTIVAYGDHGSDCHAVPSERVLKEGENVIVDMGCQYQGYCSDMTRTFFVNYNGEKEIYDVVLAANLAGIAAVKPGARFSDVDKAAREVIEKAGYGQYFIHRLGHGIGMEVHEPFDVSGANDQLIEEGMCFSIEPGVYIPGRMGVRIEDLVMCTKDGVEVLNHHSKTDEVIKR